MLVADEGDIDDGIIVVEDRFMDDNGNEGIDFGKHESEGNNQPWQANEDPAKVAKVINLDWDKQKVQLDLRMRCRMTWLFLHNLILRLCYHLSQIFVGGNDLVGGDSGERYGLNALVEVPHEGRIVPSDGHVGSALELLEQSIKLSVSD